MIVHQVPAPALVVAAQQRDVPVTLQRRILGGYPYNRHRAQRTLPDHLPGVPAVPEADLPPRRVRALRHRVAVQRESVRFDVDVARTVVRVPGVIEGSQLRLVRGHGREYVQFERLLGQLADAVHAPHVVVLVVQEAVPALADQRAVAEVVQREVREYRLQDVVRHQRRGCRFHFRFVVVPRFSRSRRRLCCCQFTDFYRGVVFNQGVEDYCTATLH